MATTKVKTYKAAQKITVSKNKSKRLWQEPNTTNTFWFAWGCSLKNVDHYTVVWEYFNKKWYPGTTNTTPSKKDSYSPPEQATKVRVKVTATAKTHKVNKKDTPYWKLSGYRGPFVKDIDELYNQQMANPSVPELKFVHKGDGYQLVSTVQDYSSGVEHKTGEIQGYILFTIEAKGQLQNNVIHVGTPTKVGNFSTGGGLISIKANNETISDYVQVSNNENNTGMDVTYLSRNTYLPGQEVRVSVRAYNIKGSTAPVRPSSIVYSDWIYVPPAAPSVRVTPIEVLNDKAFVKLEWYYPNSNASTNGIETITFRYATSNPNNLETSGSTASISRENGSLKTSMIVEMPIGQKIYIQAAASNEQGSSEFGNYELLTIGKAPLAPTTWSSTNSVIVGEKVILYWTHNPTDSSEQTKVRLLITSSIDDSTVLNTTFKTPKDDYGYIQSSYILDTSQFSNLTEGANLNWSVWTWGVDESKESPQSEIRKLDVYARPSANAYLSFINGDEEESTVSSFPIIVGARPLPMTQKPIGYFVSVIALESYEDVDVTGNVKKISEGEEIFSRDIDVNLDYETDRQNLLLELSAGDINLADNQSYEVVVTASMDSGLSATESLQFSVSWDENSLMPNADVYFDEDKLTCSIYPYVETRRYEDDPRYYRLQYDEATNTYIEGDQIEGVDLFGEEIDGAITNNDNPVYFYQLPVETTNEDILICFKDSSDGENSRTPYYVYMDGDTYLRGEKVEVYYDNFEPIPDAFTFVEDLQVYKVILTEVESYIDLYYTVDYGELYYPDDVLLNAYRIQYDGSLIAIDTNIENSDHAMLIDPHPALDYGRYRISAQSKDTGAVAFIDIYEPTLSGNDKLNYCVLQWNEVWREYTTEPQDQASILEDSEDFEEDNYSGSMLKLPWNIDLTDNYQVDVTTVNYIGRTSPVSYYGTQVNLTTSLSTDVDKTDTTTLFAIRRLASYRGDVYVREPSGNGYWATIKVNYSRNHKELIMPVSFDITRVEGGI